MSVHTKHTGLRKFFTKKNKDKKHAVLTMVNNADDDLKEELSNLPSPQSEEPVEELSPSEPIIATESEDESDLKEPIGVQSLLSIPKGPKKEIPYNKEAFLDAKLKNGWPLQVNYRKPL